MTYSFFQMIHMSRILSFTLLLACLPAALAEDVPVQGRRVFSAGHSFHMPMPGPLEQIAKVN